MVSKLVWAATYSPPCGVPSALEGLTSVFGMGTGDPLRYRHPKTLRSYPQNCTVRRLQGAQPPKTPGASRCCAAAPLYTPTCFAKSSPRPISTGLLHDLRRFHSRPIYLVIFQGPYSLHGMGDLIFGSASHLDAFSAYPFRPWLPSGAPGGTTGTPAGRPPRSSRTRGRSRQISCACDG